MTNRFDEYQRLAKLYGELSDFELLELGRKLEDLTAVAQDALRTEMSKRRLSLAQEDIPTLSWGPEIDEGELGSFAMLSSKGCVWEFAESEDAQAAAEMLRDAGIKCDVILPRLENLDMGAPRIAVLPKDVARTQQLLSRPIPEEFRTLVRTPDQFVSPVCPTCCAVDPLLESIEPVNTWHCEVCGHDWSETLPD